MKKTDSLFETIARRNFETANGFMVNKGYQPSRNADVLAQRLYAFAKQHDPELTELSEIHPDKELFATPVSGFKNAEGGGFHNCNGNSGCGCNKKSNADGGTAPAAAASHAIANNHTIQLIGLIAVVGIIAMCIKN